MSRRPHYLKANHRMRLPLRMIWVDTEAVNEHGRAEAGEQRLTFGVATYERYTDSKADNPIITDSLRFTSAGSFWDWVVSCTLPGRALWVMAHNWNYDAGILNTSNELINRGWTCLKYINGKPPLVVRWGKDGRTITLVDTLNYFAGSVAGIGRSIGRPKLDFPDSGASIERWDAYAWRDVEIIQRVFNAFRSFVREHDLGVMQPTVASQALTAYRHRFMHEKLLVHDNERALLLEREAYHGGRTDCFWRGPAKGPLYKLDINSMYPYIMRNFPLAPRFKAYFPSYKSAWFHAMMGGYRVVARCKVDTDEPAYGVVREHKLIFPIGRFETVLSTPEIEYALEQDHLMGVGEWACYESGELFRDYVDYFYNLRTQYKREGNGTFDLLCKLMMNSLYGKFGQNGRKWVETEAYDWVDGIEGGYQETPESPVVRLRTRLNRRQVLETGHESENSMPIISAEITAYGRMMLWGLIQQAGLENVYYVDTDSLVVSVDGYNLLLDTLSETKMGCLKMESIDNHGVFWAPKDYVLGDVRKIKGIRNTAVKVSPTTFEQDMFRSWDYNLSRGVDGHIDVVRQTKHLSRVNHKVVVSGYGPTNPIELMEW